MGSPADKSSLVVLGRIGRVHGIKGWLRIISYTDPEQNIFKYPLFEARLHEQRLVLEMDESRPKGKVLLAHFIGYDTPEQARALTGLDLQVVAKALPELAEGEFYWHQLPGLRVRNLQDQDFGRVAGLLETGANDVLVVKGDHCSMDRRERLIPWLQHSVIKRVDLAQGLITVDWEADYLA
jgi:16S rRNA processing protein RimM